MGPREDSDRRLVEPFVRRIEFGQDDDEDFHAADGAVAGAGTDHDAGAGADRDALTVEFHLRVRAAFEEVVGLCQPPVVMDLRVFGDLCDMHGAGEVGDVAEGTARGAAGAGDACDLGEVSDFEAGRHGAKGRDAEDAGLREGRRLKEVRCKEVVVSDGTRVVAVNL